MDAEGPLVRLEGQNRRTDMKGIGKWQIISACIEYSDFQKELENQDQIEFEESSQELYKALEGYYWYRCHWF